jgi:two-component system, OmpR family, sensor histidine kinase VicK
LTTAANDAKNSSLGRIEILHNTDNIIHTYLQALHNAKSRWDYCTDIKALSEVFTIDSIKKALLDAKERRGIIIRFVTEITSDNIPYCKEIMKIGKVRHLDGVKGNFGISDTEYISTASPIGSEPIISHLIYSNVREDLLQQHYTFDILWNTAIPAERRIREIEEGIERVETIALEDSTKILERIKKNIESSNEIKICFQPGGLQLIYNNFLEPYKKVLDAYKKGYHKGIRCITAINRDNEEIATLFLNEGVQIRHTKNLTPLSFIISSKEFLATAEKLEGGNMVRNLLVSTEPLYINHYDSIFERLWENSIDATDRINDIKEGVDLADIEVIPRSGRARLLYLDLVKNAKEEILFNFPTSDAFIRQERMGAIPLAIEAAETSSVTVRILVPFSQSLEHRVKVLGLKRTEEGITKHNHNVTLRYIDQTSHAKATILVVDRKASLAMELRDDSKTTFDEAIGLSTYSNSIAGVLSYVAMFEKLWDQTILVEQLKDLNRRLETSNEHIKIANEQLASANERLILHDKMQREFINVAAHELRTPIQPILSTIGLLRSSNQALIRKEDLDDSINMITRNATRLKQLSEDILDVTKIESQSLNLRIEVCVLNDIVLNSIDEYRTNQVIRSKKKIEIKYTSYVDKVFVEVDKSRIAQVISNLLSNAIKFTREGKIVVNIRRNQSNNKQVTVSVKDSGEGIDPEVFPRLFDKFVSKSFQGAGLGLFISRSIIEAHGGRIWAENNDKGLDQRGSTFFFTLPIINSVPHQHNQGANSQ